jgi:hypothetical protein
MNAKNAATSKAERDFARPLLLSALDALKETIREKELHHGEYLVRRVAAQCNALQIPHEAELNHLTRYENQLLRNIYRAEHELERMQRLRRGEKVPPPTARVN